MWRYGRALWLLYRHDAAPLAVGNGEDVTVATKGAVSPVYTGYITVATFTACEPERLSRSRDCFRVSCQRCLLVSLHEGRSLGMSGTTVNAAADDE